MAMNYRGKPPGFDRAGLGVRSPLPARPAPAGKADLSVQQLLALAKAMLEDSFIGAWVKGEVANFKEAGSGHWYFSLKDADAEIKIAMFRNRNLYASVKPSNGMLLRVRGRVTIFEARGELQLVAEQLAEAGVGDQALDFEALKAKLSAEGLFANERKRELPKFPRYIALVSSPDAAAVQDFLVTLARRYPLAYVELWPSLVQGEQAPAQLCEALRAISEQQLADIVVLTRGGGAQQDLHAYNDEAVVRAVAGCSVPIISAVGHETDVTLSDFAADIRAATPTAAAELIGIDQRELQRTVHQLQQRLLRAVQNRIEPLQQRVDYAKRLLDARNPRNLVQGQHERLQRAHSALLRVAQSAANERRAKLVHLHLRVQARSPLQLLEQAQRTLERNRARLLPALQNRFETYRQRLARAASILQALSHERTLERGYAMVRDRQGRVLSEAQQTHAGQKLDLQFKDGTIQVTRDGASDGRSNE